MILKNKHKILIGVVGLVAMFFVLPDSITKGLVNFVPGCSESVETETIIDSTETINEYRFLNRDSLKAILIDSLKKELKPKQILVFREANKDSIYREANRYWRERYAVDSLSAKDTSNVKVYVSQIDTAFVVKDSVDRVTDEFEVSSTFISPYVLHPDSYHDINIKHIRRGYDEMTIRKANALADNFSVGTTIGGGYGLIHKKFDFFVGIGVTYEFNLSDLFGG